MRSPGGRRTRDPNSSWRGFITEGWVAESQADTEISQAARSRHHRLGSVGGDLLPPMRAIWAFVPARENSARKQKAAAFTSNEWTRVRVTVKRLTFFPQQQNGALSLCRRPAQLSGQKMISIGRFDNREAGETQICRHFKKKKEWPVSFKDKVQ